MVQKEEGENKTRDEVESQGIGGVFRKISDNISRKFNKTRSTVQDATEEVIEKSTYEGISDLLNAHKGKKLTAEEAIQELLLLHTGATEENILRAFPELKNPTRLVKFDTAARYAAKIEYYAADGSYIGYTALNYSGNPTAKIG